MTARASRCESAYIIHDDGSIGFALGDYEASRELVIDPILDYTTFVGGTGYDTVEGIAADDCWQRLHHGLLRVDRFSDHGGRI